MILSKVSKSGQVASKGEGEKGFFGFVILFILKRLPVQVESAADGQRTVTMHVKFFEHSIAEDFRAEGATCAFLRNLKNCMVFVAEPSRVAKSKKALLIMKEALRRNGVVLVFFRMPG